MNVTVRKIMVINCTSSIFDVVLNILQPKRNNIINVCYSYKYTNSTVLKTANDFTNGRFCTLVQFVVHHSEGRITPPK